MDWPGLFLSLRGRIGRGAFWLGFGLVVAAGVALGMIPAAGPWLVLPLIWPQVALHAKRLHDMGRSAWWMLLPTGLATASLTGVIVAAGGALNAAALSDHGADAALSAQAQQGTLVAIGLGLLTLLIGLGFLSWVGFAPGQAQANRYGRPPAAKNRSVALDS